ncbi:MAG: CBS domain-containing protein [Acidimicrobiales bacterium]
MKVESILKAKGHGAETIEPGAGVALAVHKLASRGIGALVVSHDGQRVEGLIGERDIVQGLNRHGARLLELTVGDVMSRSVPVCSSADAIRDVMATMTRSRNRHLPVVDRGRLSGVVSVGDVVKNRLDEIELEASVLRGTYLAGH